MSMRGEKISDEYQRMVFVQATDGKEYACYGEDLEDSGQKRDLTPEEREKCLDTSLVLGDSW
jgi:hypothetical protein